MKTTRVNPRKAPCYCGSRGYLAHTPKTGDLCPRNRKIEITSYTLEDRKMCPECLAFAVVPLTPSQLAAQPDNTTHVCHPAFGGCNLGYGK